MSNLDYTGGVSSNNHAPDPSVADHENVGPGESVQGESANQQRPSSAMVLHEADPAPVESTSDTSITTATVADPSLVSPSRQQTRAGIDLPIQIQQVTGISIRQHGAGYRAEYCPFCESSDGFNLPTDGSYYQCFACGQAGSTLPELASQLTTAGRDELAGQVRQYIARGHDRTSPNAPPCTPPASFPPSPPPDVSGDRIQALKQFAAEYYQRIRREQADQFAYERDGERATVGEYLRLRAHSVETLDEFLVGLADGRLCVAAGEQGYTPDELQAAGLMKRYSADYWPAGVVLFPHLENGRVSHFSQKDPSGLHAFQSKKTQRSSSCLWYNQDASHDAAEVVLVEGENDLLSVVGKAGYRSVMACNGSISREQTGFLLRLSSLRRLILCFDNDAAGRRYSQKVIRTFASRQVEVVEIHLPDDVKDIDEALRQADDAAATFTMFLEDADPPVERESPIVVDHEGHRYLYRTVSQRENGEQQVRLQPITNFLIEIVHRVRTSSGCERYIRLTNCNGELTPIFRMEASSMTTPLELKKYVMSKGNFLVTATGGQLDALWEYHFSQDEGREIHEPAYIGYQPNHGLWLFGNLAIKDGQVYCPDEEGIIWVGDAGFRPRANGDPDESSGLPTVAVLEGCEAEQLLERFLRLFHDNIGYNAYLIVGWVFATLFSHQIFERFRCFPGLILYGPLQVGKGTVGNWVMSMFGMSIASAKQFFETTVTGMNRLFAACSSMPVWLDEYRHDDRQSRGKYAFLRSVFDRTTAGKGVKDDSHSIRTVAIRGTLLLSGEHLPPDPAFRSRNVQAWLSRRVRNDAPFAELERLADQLSAITVHWLRTMTPERINELISEIESLRRAFVEREHWDPRTALVYAIATAGFLFIREDGEFLRWVIEHGAADRAAREQESPLVTFFGDLENLLIRGELDGKYMVLDGDELYLHHQGVYRVWQADHRRRTNDTPWPLETLVDHLKEQGCLLDHKAQKKLGGSNHRCLKINLTRAPEVVRELAELLRDKAPTARGEPIGEEVAPPVTESVDTSMSQGCTEDELSDNTAAVTQE